MSGHGHGRLPLRSSYPNDSTFTPSSDNRTIGRESSRVGRGVGSLDTGARVLRDRRSMSHGAGYGPGSELLSGSTENGQHTSSYEASTSRKARSVQHFYGQGSAPSTPSAFETSLGAHNTSQKPKLSKHAQHETKFVCLKSIPGRNKQCGMTFDRQTDLDQHYDSEHKKKVRHYDHQYSSYTRKGDHAYRRAHRTHQTQGHQQVPELGSGVIDARPRSHDITAQSLLPPRRSSRSSDVVADEHSTTPHDASGEVMKSLETLRLQGDSRPVESFKATTQPRHVSNLPLHNDIVQTMSKHQNLPTRPSHQVSMGTSAPQGQYTKSTWTADKLISPPRVIVHKDSLAELSVPTSIETANVPGQVNSMTEATLSPVSVPPSVSTAPSSSATDMEDEEQALISLPEDQWAARAKASLLERYLNDVLSYAVCYASHAFQAIMVGCQGSDSGNNETAAPPSTPSTADRGSSNGKRPRAGSAKPTDKSNSPGDGNGGSGDENGAKRQRRQPSDKVPPPRFLFACPFHKNDRDNYRDSACVRGAWPETRYVKAHIYKYHKQPIHCPRCKEKFETDADLSNHLMEDARCEKREASRSGEGVTPDQLTEIRDKKKMPQVSQEDKWRRIYRIIFNLPADAETPSPYYEMDTSQFKHLTNFKEDLHKNLPRLMQCDLTRKFQARYPTHTLPDLSGMFDAVVKSGIERVYEDYVSKTSPSEKIPVEAIEEAQITADQSTTPWLLPNAPQRRGSDVPRRSSQNRKSHSFVPQSGLDSPLSHSQSLELNPWIYTSLVSDFTSSQGALSQRSSTELIRHSPQEPISNSLAGISTPQEGGSGGFVEVDRLHAPSVTTASSMSSIPNSYHGSFQQPLDTVPPQQHIPELDLTGNMSFGWEIPFTTANTNASTLNGNMDEDHVMHGNMPGLPSIPAGSYAPNRANESINFGTQNPQEDPWSQMHLRLGQ